MATTQPQRNHPCLSPSHTRSAVFEDRFELLRSSARGRPPYLVKKNMIKISSDLRFSQFSDQLLLRERFLRRKVLLKCFSCPINKLGFVVVCGRYQKKKVSITFFLSHKSRSSCRNMTYYKLLLLCVAKIRLLQIVAVVKVKYVSATLRLPLCFVLLSLSSWLHRHYYPAAITQPPSDNILFGEGQHGVQNDTTMMV